MSETYYLVCHEHKELIWIGQGNTFETFCLYEDDSIMERFLWRHKGCDLKFQESNKLDEIEKIKFGVKVKGKLLGFPVYCEFTHHSQIRGVL